MGRLRSRTWPTGRTSLPMSAPRHNSVGVFGKRSYVLLVTVFALLVGLPSVNAKALKWTPQEFQNSLSSSSPKPHLLKLYAPWCGHCKKMAPAFDETATALKSKNFEVGKVDCADRSDGGADFCSAIGVKGFPSVKLFLPNENGMVDFHGKDRSTTAFVRFALGGHNGRPRQSYELLEVQVEMADETAEDDDETNQQTTAAKIKLIPKTGFEKYKDVVVNFLMDVIEDVKQCVKEHPLGSLTIFAAAFFTALFGIVLTDLISERLGIPRRGESWDDVTRRRDWEVEREKVLGKKEKKKEN